MEVVALKDRIELLPKQYHIEIARIIVNTNTPFNENQNGIFVNLSNVQPTVMERLVNYLQYVELQERDLRVDETQKNDLKDEFFSASNG
jgi:hypothetical protein